MACGLDVLDVASGEGDGSFSLSHVAKALVGVDIAVNNVTRKYLQDNLKFVHRNHFRFPGRSLTVVE